MDNFSDKEAVEPATGVCADSSRDELYRLTELTVKWVISNPEPIKLEKVEYTR